MKTLFLIIPVLTVVGLRAENYSIAILPKGASAYWQSIHAGAAKAQHELEAAGDKVELFWIPPTGDGDINEQKEQLKTAIAKKVNGIVIAPVDTAVMSAPVAAAMASGVPVVVIDSALKSGAPVSFIATDNAKGGALAAHRLASILHQTGRICVIQFRKGSANTEARVSSFVETIKSQHAKVETVVSPYCGGSLDACKQACAQIVADMIKSGANYDAFFCPNVYTTLGLVDALRANGLAGKIPVVGFDANAASIEALKAHSIQGLIVQNPVLMGYDGVMMMVAHLKKKPCETVIDTECTVITAENMDTPAAKALLNPPTLP